MSAPTTHSESSQPDRRRTLSEIRHGDDTLAIILSRDFEEPGLHFVTPDSFSQQLAYMHYPAGKTIPPHMHGPVHREIDDTLEVLFLKRGKLRVDFFDQDEKFLQSRVLVGGDVILLVKGGHGFEVLEELEMYEVKQGPYAGDAAKRRFVPKAPAGPPFASRECDD